MARLFEVAVGQGRDPGRAVLARLDRERAPAVMVEGEADVRPRHGEALHDVEASAIFAALGAQELAPGRYAGEQLLDDDAGARRQGGRPLPFELAIVDDARPAVLAIQPGLDRHPGDAGDRRQRLAAETQGLDLVDRIGRQLGGGVPLQRQRDLIAGHAAAVVGDLDPADSALRQRHGDPGRAGIDRVFNQLFQRTGRPFNHFTGCNAVDKVLGQAPY